ncbi:MAG: hypothetical protein SGARI_006541, partial [Bacillariaceae sp.]
PLNWADVEEHIDMAGFVENNQIQYCPMEDVKHLEVHVGGRSKAFGDATRTMCGQFNINTGRIGYYYIFEDFIPENGFQPPVEVIATVVFHIKPEVMAQRNIRMYTDSNDRADFFALLNPANFTGNDIAGHVTFDHLSFHPHFPPEDMEDEEDDEDSEGEEAE